MRTATDRFEVVCDIFKAVSTPVRLKILLLLLENEELFVTEFQEELDVSQSLLSQHLLWLRKAGLVKKRREDNRCYYFLTSRGETFALLGKKLLKERR